MAAVKHANANGITEEERFQRWELLRMLHDAGNWRKALDVLENCPPDPLLLWLRPSVSWLHQLADVLAKLHVHQVISIGCGCGLLEWLLSASTNASPNPLEVIGLEINRTWWESKRSPPSFTPLVFPDEDEQVMIDPKHCALMFCYFNDLNAFEEYLQQFGDVDVVVIAGPSPGGKVHCEPEPMDNVLGGDWRRVALVQTGDGDSEHLAAVYSKSLCHLKDDSCSATSVVTQFRNTREYRHCRYSVRKSDLKKYRYFYYIRAQSAEPCGI